MKRKIILDRSFAFYLLNYIAKMENKDIPPELGISKDEKLINQTIRTINYALLLFDKVLIEDNYGSSLYHFVQDKEWFWEMFEVFSPDQLTGTEQELSIMIEDSVALDLVDQGIKKIVKADFPERYRENKSFTSLIWNINKTLQAARYLDAAILPWPPKSKIYEYKFNQSINFINEKKPYSLLSSILDFQAPAFDITSLSNIISFRKDKRVLSFRKLIWELVENPNISDRESILQKLEDEKGKLVQVMSPSWTTVIRGLVSLPVPFPFNVALESTYNIIDLLKINPYSWYFFLIDLRVQNHKEVKSK